MSESARGGILSSVQLTKLREYRYRSSNISILDPIFQPYWNWLCSKLPLWLAPNLITIIGLVVNISSSILLLYFSPNLKEPVPKWACWVAAIGVFIYQSLDAVDGKQARRTKTSSALGELFDHGCDSLGTVFLTLDACIACQLGIWPNVTLFHCMLSLLVFYCGHWRTYVTGTLHFGALDVTEAEVAIISVLLTSGTLGSSFWTRATFFGVEWGKILVFSTTIFVLLAIYDSLQIVLGKYGAGKNGSTVAGTSVITPAIPIGLALGLMLWLAVGTDKSVYGSHPTLFIITTGLIASKVTDRLIVAHMTRSDIKFFDSVLIPPCLLLVNRILQVGISESALLWLTFLVVLADFIVYTYKVMTEICRYLGVTMFRI